MHPPKTVLFDLAAGTNIDTKGCARAVDEYRLTPFGLYMSRAIVDRSTAYWIQSWLLPDLGLCVTDWWWNPGHHRDQDFYLDVCEIERDGDRWRLTDHYLDIVVRTGRDAEVIDVDEFVAAVASRPAQPGRRRGGHAPHAPGGGRDRRARTRPRCLARRLRDQR